MAIVSNDKGYNAVQDYWSSCVKPARKVLLQPNIEQCIGCSNESSDRKKLIQGRLQEVNLETEYRLYREHLKMRRTLEEIFSDTAYRKLIGQIFGVVEGRKEHEPKELYLDTIKRFGREDGLEIYRRIKPVFGAEREKAMDER